MNELDLRNIDGQPVFHQNRPVDMFGQPAEYDYDVLIGVVDGQPIWGHLGGEHSTGKTGMCFAPNGGAASWYAECDLHAGHAGPHASWNRLEETLYTFDECHCPYCVGEGRTGPDGAREPCWTSPAFMASCSNSYFIDDNLMFAMMMGIDFTTQRQRG